MTISREYEASDTIYFRSSLCGFSQPPLSPPRNTARASFKPDVPSVGSRTRDHCCRRAALVDTLAVNPPSAEFPIVSNSRRRTGFRSSHHRANAPPDCRSGKKTAGRPRQVALPEQYRYRGYRGGLLSGEGVGWAKIKEMQTATPLPNVTLLERVPDAQLESFLSAADIWIIPYRRNNTGVSVPSRIYNLLAVGRPVIICSEPDAEAALLVREEEIGWVVPPENADAIAHAISAAAAAQEATREKGHRATVVASRYTGPIALKAYRNLMNDLLDRNLSKAGTDRRPSVREVEQLDRLHP